MKISYEDGEIVVRVPFSEVDIAKAPITQSGNSHMLASTKGFIRVDGTPESIKIGVNVISVIPKSERRKA